MSILTSSLFLPCVSLVASIGALLYSRKTSRECRFIRDELAERQRIGNDAWMEKHIQRWRGGRLAGRIEKGTGVSGSDVEFIEPLRGWKIIVATFVDGKRVETMSSAGGASRLGANGDYDTASL